MDETVGEALKKILQEIDETMREVDQLAREINEIAADVRKSMHQMPPMFTALNGGTESEYERKNAEECKRRSGSKYFHAWDGLD